MIRSLRREDSGIPLPSRYLSKFPAWSFKNSLLASSAQLLITIKVPFGPTVSILDQVRDMTSGHALAAAYPVMAC
jgi:hypothetical protein